MRKVQVTSACSNCKKAHLACDDERPCKRCSRSGKPDSCVDVEHKKRGRPRLSKYDIVADAPPQPTLPPPPPLPPTGVLTPDSPPLQPSELVPHPSTTTTSSSSSLLHLQQKPHAATRQLETPPSTTASSSSTTGPPTSQSQSLSLVQSLSLAMQQETSSSSSSSVRDVAFQLPESVENARLATTSALLRDAMSSSLPTQYEYNHPRGPQPPYAHHHHHHQPTQQYQNYHTPHAAQASSDFYSRSHQQQQQQQQQQSADEQHHKYLYPSSQGQGQPAPPHRPMTMMMTAAAAADYPGQRQIAAGPTLTNGDPSSGAKPGGQYAFPSSSYPQVTMFNPSPVQPPPMTQQQPSSTVYQQQQQQQQQTALHQHQQQQQASLQQQQQQQHQHASPHVQRHSHPSEQSQHTGPYHITAHPPSRKDLHGAANEDALSKYPLEVGVQDLDLRRASVEFNKLFGSIPLVQNGGKTTLYHLAHDLDREKLFAIHRTLASTVSDMALQPFGSPDWSKQLILTSQAIHFRVQNGVYELFDLSFFPCQDLPSLANQLRTQSAGTVSVLCVLAKFQHSLYSYDWSTYIQSTSTTNNNEPPSAKVKATKHVDHHHHQQAIANANALSSSSSLSSFSDMDRRMLGSFSSQPSSGGSSSATPNAPSYPSSNHNAFANTHAHAHAHAHAFPTEMAVAAAGGKQTGPVDNVDEARRTMHSHNHNHNHNHSHSHSGSSSWSSAEPVSSSEPLSNNHHHSHHHNATNTTFGGEFTSSSSHPSLEHSASTSSSPYASVVPPEKQPEQPSQPQPPLQFQPQLPPTRLA